MEREGERQVDRHRETVVGQRMAGRRMKNKARGHRGKWIEAGA